MLKKILLLFIPCRKNNYRPLILDGKFFTYIVLILITLKLAGFFYFLIIPKTNFFADISSCILINMVNEDRGEIGLSHLSENPLLTRAAYLKAQDMAQKGYFSHWSPDGISPWYWIKEAGYDYRYAGENLAMGFLDASEVHQAWLNSYSHRENLLNSKYDEIGIAVVETNFEGKSVYLVVQMFGSRYVPNTLINTTPEVIKSNVAAKIEKEDDNTKVDLEIKDEDLTTTISSLEQDSQTELSVGEGKLALGDYDEGIYIEIPRIKRISDLKLGLLMFFMTKYDLLIQKIAIITFSFLMFVFLVNIFISFDVRHPDIILKGLLILGIFIIFNCFNQEMIINFMVGNLTIG